ncbi:MAG TPA: T3SS effector HopA1 family protein [Thermoanaerobaculia bacterium]|jgi:hypothetical protein
MNADLLEVVDAVSIESPARYSLLGQPRDLSAMPGEPRARMLQTMENDLYVRMYTRPSSGSGVAADMLGQRDHVAALSAANNGHGSWEPGWRVGEIDEEDGRVAVSKDAITFWVDPATGIRTATGRASPGDYCRVRVAKELRNLMPGFYFAIGDGDQADTRDQPEPLVRFYWNLTAAGAAPYIAAATETLNAIAVPFRTKVLTDPSSYIRADGGVLYLERRHFHRVRSALVGIHDAIASYLRPEVPMFTKALAPGLGLAEDPGGGMSFGQSRCRALAHGLWDAFASGADKLETVQQALVAAKVDVDRPWLEKGSSDMYLLEAASREERRAAELELRRREKKERKAR